jgi:hypothetical protein
MVWATNRRNSGPVRVDGLPSTLRRMGHRHLRSHCDEHSPRADHGPATRGNPVRRRAAPLTQREERSHQRKRNTATLAAEFGQTGSRVIPVLTWLFRRQGSRSPRQQAAPPFRATHSSGAHALASLSLVKAIAACAPAHR